MVEEAGCRVRARASNGNRGQEILIAVTRTPAA